MADKDGAKPGGQFSALLAALPLIAALVYLVGFTYRWSYYYNFGVPSIAFGLSVQTVLVAAFEVLKRPANLALGLLAAVGPLLIFNLLLLPAARRVAGKAAGAGGERRSAPSLLLDVIRVLLVVIPACLFSGLVGYRAFQRAAVDSPANPLPRVTVVLENEPRGAEERAVLKWTGPGRAGVEVIGDINRLEQIRTHLLTGSRDQTVWRLLHMNDSTIFVFASSATASAKRRRPLTLAIPRGPGVYVLLN